MLNSYTYLKYNYFESQHIQHTKCNYQGKLRSQSEECFTGSKNKQCEMFNLRITVSNWQHSQSKQINLLWITFKEVIKNIKRRYKVMGKWQIGEKMLSEPYIRKLFKKA